MEDPREEGRPIPVGEIQGGDKEPQDLYAPVIDKTTMLSRCRSYQDLTPHWTFLTPALLYLIGRLDRDPVAEWVQTREDRVSVFVDDARDKLFDLPEPWCRRVWGVESRVASSLLRHLASVAILDHDRKAFYYSFVRPVRCPDVLKIHHSPCTDDVRMPTFSVHTVGLVNTEVLYAMVDQVSLPPSHKGAHTKPWPRPRPCRMKPPRGYQDSGRTYVLPDGMFVMPDNAAAPDYPVLEPCQPLAGTADELQSLREQYDKAFPGVIRSLS